MYAPRPVLALVFALALCSITNAQVVMNYQGNAIGVAPATYTESGIRQQASVSSGNLQFNFGNPTPGFALNSNTGGMATWDLVSGNPFDFSSIDLSAQFSSVLTFQGTYAAGGTVTETYTTTNAVNQFKTFHPTMNFTGLSSVKLTFPAGGGVLAMDNVTLPEPASAGAIALGGLLLSARRRRR